VVRGTDRGRTRSLVGSLSSMSEVPPSQPFPRKLTISLGQGNDGEWRCGATLIVEGETWVELSEYRKGEGWMHAGWARNVYDGTRLVSAMNSQGSLVAGCNAAIESLRQRHEPSLELFNKLRDALDRFEAGAKDCESARVNQRKRDRARQNAIRQWAAKSSESSPDE
jgi:hypothetical protein